MEYFLNILIQYYPQIGVYAVILFFVVVATIKIYGFYIKTKAVHSKMPNIEKTLSHIDKGLILLNNVLLEKTIISQSCYSNGNSPRVINPIGEELLRESGGDIIFNAKKDDLVVELERKTINSLLELEKESLNTILAHRDDRDYKPLQDFAFQHPTFKDNPLTYTDLLFVVALELRDFYMARHPELRAE